jgi:hypothetical protein
MMTDLQRMDARLEMLIQAELIAGWLQGDHGLSEEKAANWNRLLSVLSKTALCFTEMEDDMLRSRTIISELRAEARSDAETIGALKREVKLLHAENDRLKENLGDALELLNTNHINQKQLWRT